MTIRMKALKPFGVPGVNEGHVKRGREFSAVGEQRCKELEAHGLAYRIDDAPAMTTALTSANADVSNEAADQGPFVSAGGETGAEDHAPSSPQGRRRRQRRSTDSGDGFLS